MNNYVVNPWVFYFMSLADSLKAVGIIFSIVLIVCIIIFVIFYKTEKDVNLRYAISDKERSRAENGIKLYGRFLKVSSIAFVSSLFIVIFIPDKTTCKEMLIASYLTESNIEYTKEEAKELVDYIFDKLENINDSSKNNKN